MLLKALYDYAQKQNLFESLPLQKRTVHFLISLNKDGTLRRDFLIPLNTKKKGKEKIGEEHLMPRFPGENNGGKAYFLAEGSVAVLGRDKDSGKCIPVPTDTKVKNPTKAFLHFWTQIEEAYKTTKDARLEAALKFRQRYIRYIDDKIHCSAPFIKIEIPPNSKDEKLYGITEQNKKHALKAATIGFQIDGNPLTLEDSDCALREYWLCQYAKEAFADDNSGASNDQSPALPRNGICLLTGEASCTIARSHKPKILGIPNLSSGGYIVSFAKESPAFSSYGFEMGENAPISEQAAASYALAANHLLGDNDTHIRLGPVSFCFWAKECQQVSKQFNLLLNKAYPEQVASFLKSPFSGISDREIKSDRFYAVAFAGNKGRIVIQHWIEQPLEQAIINYGSWWSDLNIVSLYNKKDNASKEESHPGPYAIPNLARIYIRRSKKHKDDKLVAKQIARLFRVALEGANLPIVLLKPILDEFHSALVKDSDEEKMYPFSTSRFALIKLILIRNRKDGDFMPTYELADTPDPAYNLGRLLAVFESLQDEYHNYEKKGAGVVERYYGAASSAPASAFPILCRLARHHLAKVRKENSSTANDIEEQITDILAKFQAETLGKPPAFPRILNLEQQGRFALGFYQQKA